MASFQWAAFSAALDNVRESKGHTWKQVGEITGIAMKTLNRVAAAKPCDIDTVATLRQYMGVAIDKFFTNGAA